MEHKLADGPPCVLLASPGMLQSGMRAQPCRQGTAREQRGAEDEGAVGQQPSMACTARAWPWQDGRVWPLVCTLMVWSLVWTRVQRCRWGVNPRQSNTMNILPTPLPLVWYAHGMQFWHTIPAPINTIRDLLQCYLYPC